MTKILSSIIAVLMTLISIIMPGNPKNVELTVEPVTTESTSITYTFVNNTGKIIGKPEIESLMVHKTVSYDELGTDWWETADIILSITDIGYRVKPGTSRTETAELFTVDENSNIIKGHLESGEYILTVKYRPLGIEGISGEYDVSCTFIVKDAE